MTNIAVTGAGGFVGRYLVPELLRHNHQVRALTRFGTDAPWLRDGVDWVRGDVRNRNTVETLLDGSSVVVHLGAWSFRDPEPDVIVDGTAAVLAAARARGIERIVFVSCLASSADNPSPFLQEKWKAEQMIRGSGLTYVILRPSVILGRGDGLTRPLADLVRRAPLIPLPSRSDARLQPVDVEDVVRCIVDAVSRDDVANLEISVGGPTFLTFRNLVDLIAGEIGVVRPKVQLPTSLLVGLAGRLPAAARSLFSPSRLALLTEASTTSPGNVQRLFEFEPRSVVGRLTDYLDGDPGTLS
ncbi:MAG TPA: NAD(P)H-binding protein [Chloroflexota bacterium]|nr:NAD(P)H-binding protein [Chloroflexota bacterium]